MGVHRVPRTLWSQLWPFLAVAVVTALVAVAGVLYLSRDPGPLEIGGPPAATEPPDGNGVATEPPGNGTDGAQIDPPDGNDIEEPIPTEPPAPHDPVLDFVAASQLDAHIRVLNDSGITGEAARGVTALEGRGFTNVEAANNTGASPDTTVVWYAAGYRDTAMGVAAVLGIPGEAVTQQPIRTGDVAVIIRSALSPAPTPAG